MIVKVFILVLYMLTNFDDFRDYTFCFKRIPIIIYSPPDVT